MPIKLTIFIALYNQEELVIRALDSIPKREDIEVIVIDDGSSDGSLKAVKEWKDSHDMNMTIVHQDNQGLGRAKNIAYSIARGEYIYELDNDDYLYTKEFEQAMVVLDGTDMVYVSYRTNDGTTGRVSKQTKDELVAGFTRFIRREFLGNNRTREDVWNEDWFFNQKLQAIPHTERFLTTVVYHYNYPREGSMFWEATHGIHHK